MAYRILTKKYGLNIQSSALDSLSRYVGRKFGNEWRGPKTVGFLDQVGKTWKDENRTLFMDGEGVEEVIKEIGTKQKSPQESQINSFKVYNDTQEDAVEEPESDINWQDFYQVIPVSRYRRFRYDSRRKQIDILAEQENAPGVVFPTAKDTVQFQLDRFHLLKDMLLRNEHFRPSTASVTNSITGSIHPELETQQITSIKNLLGRHGQSFVLFGLLGISASGLWQLQDDSGCTELEMSQCIFPNDAYVTLGSYVVCDGIYSNSGKFYVSSISPPPAEPRETSVEALGSIDISGIYAKNGRIDGAIKKKLPVFERKFPQHRFIFLGGDIFLNDMKVIDGLKKLFKALTDEIEESHTEILSIVIPGSFVEKPLDVSEFSSYSHITSSGLYKSYFDTLAAVLEPFPVICKKCKLVLVPGDGDPWSSVVTKGANSIWPQFRIPAIFGNRLKRVAEDVEWVSNPCKMNYLAHDITIVRDDLGDRFRRNDVSYVSKEEEAKDDTGDLTIDRLTSKLPPAQRESRKVVRSLLDQGDLSPFTAQTRSILTNYGSLMSLVPLPDLLVLVDPTVPLFDLIYENCHVVNPGKFLENGKISYIEYTPSTRKAQLRAIY